MRRLLQYLMNLTDLHIDCRYFRGDLPCKPHKQFGYHCPGCLSYDKIEQRILIIKLGAIGDVIRTTPLLRKIKTEYPKAKISWLTLTPSILPQNEIDEILKLELNSILYLQNTEFDILYNLDKDKEACALFHTVKAKKKFGYMLRDGLPYPSNELARHKYMTGVFDDISKVNTKSYVEEIFEMLGWKFQREEYLFDTHEDKGYKWDLNRNQKLIGLNTGCGDRWTSRLWSDEKWVELISKLQEAGLQPVLLGGEAEHKRNSSLQGATGATYPGYFSLPQFINLMNQMDVIVTQVTMAMHISIALKKHTVLMNNIFNPHEFDLYDRGFIVSPDKSCECFYLGKCKFGTSCMEDLPAQKVFDHVMKCLN